MVWLVVAACGCQLVAALTVCFTRSRRSRKARDAEFSTVPAMRSTGHQEPVTDYYASSAAPTSTSAGSTGPLVGDNTYSTAGHNNTTYAAPVGAYNTAETAPVEPMGATTTSGANGHWWKRS